MTSKEEVVRERIRILASEGERFGPGKLVEVRNSDSNKAAQFASQVFFFDVVLQDSGNQNVISVVAKTQLNDSAMKTMQSDIQFANEVAMYQNILPALGACELNVAPKFFYAHVEEQGSHENDIVILENLKLAGFRVAENLFLDHEHVTLAMKKLGKVHGLSYRMKRANKEKIASLAKQLRLVRRNEEDPDGPAVADAYFYRAFKDIIDTDASADNIAEKALEKLSNTLNKYHWDIFIKPEEPFAVIVLGDFNSNNVMYSYDKTGRPIDVKFFDFGTSLYSDPSVDIAFFLYMNTSEENRQKHWDDWFKSYWDGLTNIEPQPGFTFDEFLANFSKRAIYGFLPTSFYVPAMMTDDMPTSLEGWLAMAVTLEEKLNLAKTIGGEEATTATTNIVRHLYDRGFLRDFTEKFETPEAESST